jgi:hypothetical protein
VGGAVEIEGEPAHRYLRTRLRFSVQAVKQLLAQHVLANPPAASSAIDEQPETRPEWRDRYDYHYDLRVQIGGRLVYFETRLLETRTGPVIRVVNIHDA